MTYDELLAEIKSLNDSCSISSRLGNALKAAVELHKPTGWYEDTGYSGQECIECDSGSYPCPTIQAIEKELK